MNKFKKMAVACSVASLSIVAHAGLIDNGSFETPDLDHVNNNGGSMWEVFASIDGWNTQSGAGIEIQKSGTVVNAYDGDQYVELDSHNFGLTDDPYSNTFMSQSIDDLVAGNQYELSFWYQPRTNRADDNGINVYWGDSELSLVAQADGRRASFGGWTNFTTTLVATADEMSVGFEAFGNANTLGGFLDDVSLVEVPEPASFALFALGLMGLTAARRKKS